MSPRSKPVTLSLKVKVMVAVSPTVRRLSLIVTSTVGRRVSMLKLPLLGVLRSEIEAGDALSEGEGDGGGFANGEAVVADRHVDRGAQGVDAEVAAAGGARSGVALRVPDAGEVEADGVVGVLGVGPGRVGGGPDLAVGAALRQRAQRAFAGVVL